MKDLTRCAHALGMIAALALTVTVASADRVEVSADGHLHVTITDRDANKSQTLATGMGDPFGEEPDWTNANDEVESRLQVGGVRLADISNNGWLDIVAGCYQSQSFPPYEDWRNRVYFNDGGELEATASWISDDAVSTGDVQVGDFNNNGFIDVLAANGGFGMAPSVIYFNGPDGLSTSPGWTSNEPGNAWNNSALPIDLNNNGMIDLVTANQGNSEFDPYRPMFAFANPGVLENTPSWQSAETSIQGTLAAADVNLNGFRDVAVSKWVNFETAVYLNSNGTLQTTPAWTNGLTTSDRGVALSDVTGDGYPDLAVGENPTKLYENQQGDSFSHTWSAEGTFFGQRELHFADVTRNGSDDLAEIHFSSRRVNIYGGGNGTLTTEPVWTWQGPGVGTTLAIGDLNGNGNLDLVVGNSGDPSVFVFFAPQPKAPCPGDLTSDGMVDVSDLLILLGAWGPCEGDCPADLNDDGTVDVSDLLILLGAWGACP